MELFDTHSHYNDERFNEDLSDIIKAVITSGVSKTVCVGYSLESSQRSLEISKDYDEILSSVGISPNDINDNYIKQLEEIEKIIKNDKVVAVGEIGLDYYWNKENKEAQKDLFIKQIDLANKYDLPIIIHNRDAYLDTISILKEHEVVNKGIFHCCPLNQELIKDGLKLGFYISFSGNITFKNAKSEACVSLVPLDRLLIETDSPYLSPEPFRGTRNTPKNVVEVAKKIAEIKGVSLDDVARITYENAKRIYKL